MVLVCLCVSGVMVLWYKCISGNCGNIAWWFSAYLEGEGAPPCELHQVVVQQHLCVCVIGVGGYDRVGGVVGWRVIEGEVEW